MADGSWDNSGAPPQKKGMALWAKITLGCGVAFLLAIAGCTLVVTYGCRGMMNQAWADMRREATTLSTEEGAKRIYRENPRLAERYPTEEAFLKASAEWRASLADLPEQAPSMSDMFKGKQGGDFQFHSETQNGHEHNTIRIRLRDGRHLHLETDEKGLTDIKVD